MTSDEHGLSTEGVRLQKVMAAAGVGSRRVSEDLITAGRVRVNGKVVRELGRRVNPEADEIAVDNVAVQLDTTKRYVMLNKPVGVVSSMKDGRGRPDLTQFTEEYEERLFNVGRLDAETSGLLLLTNDGELAHVLAHPSFGVDKTYIAKVAGRVTPQTIATLRHGIELDDGFIAADSARILAGKPGGGHSTLVEVTLHSGRNRIVRRMLDAVGHPVQELVRRQFGPLHLGSLPSGRTRYLTKDELGALLTIARKAQKAQQAGSADTTGRQSHAERGQHGSPERGTGEHGGRAAREHGGRPSPKSAHGGDQGGSERPGGENQERRRSSQHRHQDPQSRDAQSRDAQTRDTHSRDAQSRAASGDSTRDRRDHRDASRGSAERSSRDAGDARRDARPGRAERDQSARRNPSSGPRHGGHRRNPGRPSSGGSGR
jgi:23S rRNA pseudouridine2605 synthase